MSDHFVFTTLQAQLEPQRRCQSTRVKKQSSTCTSSFCFAFAYSQFCVKIPLLDRCRFTPPASVTPFGSHRRHGRNIVNSWVTPELEHGILKFVALFCENRRLLCVNSALCHEDAQPTSLTQSVASAPVRKLLPNRGNPTLETLRPK